jgi:hypothetical protein
MSTHLAVLTREECVERLRRGRLGRIAVMAFDPLADS